MSIRVLLTQEFSLDLIESLATAARAEGHRFLERLATDWSSGRNRFSEPGEQLWILKLCSLPTVAKADIGVGICGLNRDPYLPIEQAAQTARLRHLYIHPDYRRRGFATRLVRQIVEDARPDFGSIRLRTENPAAARFYERLGFNPVREDAATHQLEPALFTSRGS